MSKLLLAIIRVSSFGAILRRVPARAKKLPSNRKASFALRLFLYFYLLRPYLMGLEFQNS